MLVFAGPSWAAMRTRPVQWPGPHRRPGGSGEYQHLRPARDVRSRSSHAKHVEGVYAGIVTKNNKQFARRELRLHLREHVVWERTLAPCSGRVLIAAQEGPANTNICGLRATFDLDHLVTKNNKQFARRELRLHLREHVVWERNTVWREMIDS
jgi:hypothetical protein